MRSLSINVYQYDELTPKAQAKAREWYKEVFEPDNNLLKDDMHEIIAENGYGRDMNVIWSLGYCQGDGATFYGRLNAETLDRLATRLLDGKDARRWKRVKSVWHAAGEIKHTGRYCHAYSVDVVIDTWGLTRAVETLLDRLQAAILDDVQRVSKELERYGYEFYESERDDENVAEVIRANEYEFTSDGSRYKAVSA